jgi:hypothetical protein
MARGKLKRRSFDIVLADRMIGTQANVEETSANTTTTHSMLSN